jgi:hypothetical protein
MERNLPGALRTPSAPAAHRILMRLSKSALSLRHARLLSRSGAAAFGGGRSTSCGAASGRTGASGASQRVLRTHCDAAESGFIGRRRRLGRALYPPTDAGFE